MPVTLMRKPDTSIEVRLTRREISRIDRYVQHILLTLPVEVRYSRNSAIRDLLAEALDLHSISEEREEECETDESQP